MATTGSTTPMPNPTSIDDATATISAADSFSIMSSLRGSAPSDAGRAASVANSATDGPRAASYGPGTRAHPGGPAVTESSDEALAAAAARGDVDAFRTIYDRHRKMV